MNEEGNKMNPMMIVGVIAMVAIVGGVMMISGQKNSSGSVTPTPEVMKAKPTNSVMGAETEVKTIQMDAGSFYYKPNQIKLKKGEKVKIVMTSKDMMHDFNIDELGVKMPVTKSGETSEVEFTADKAGTFEYYCSVGQHRKNGQVGTLIVE